MKHNLSDVEASHVIGAIQFMLEKHGGLTFSYREILESIKVRLVAGLGEKLRPETLRRLQLL